LKQHVKIVPIDGTPATSAAPTPSGTPSKPPKTESSTPPKPVKAENTKPESSSSTSLDSPKTIAETAPSTLTLAMRQAGQEAAQKAKDAKKKAAEVFTGKGEVEPTTKEPDRVGNIPPPILVDKDVPTHDSVAATTASMQSPTSTAWKNKPSAHGRQSSLSHAFMGPMQSPNSTAWKSTDIDPPITMHRGSSISAASAEEIRAIEKSQAIEEEDEETDEEDAIENAVEG
jgi:hypothetical protein